MQFRYSQETELHQLLAKFKFQTLSLFRLVLSFDVEEQDDTGDSFALDGSLLASNYQNAGI